MEFTQSEPNQWTSPESYKITWRDNVQGVKVRPAYHAQVKLANGSWWFAGKRGPYYSLNTATQACERHFKYWQRAINLAQRQRKGRVAKIDALKVKAVAGKGVTSNRLLAFVPAWVATMVDANVLARLFKKARAKAAESE